MIHHPRSAPQGIPVPLHHPHHPSPLPAWTDPFAQATVVPDGPMPAGLHGIPFASWREAPADRAGWARLADEMPFEAPHFDAMGMEPAAGAVILEPDGRIWLVAPSNAFGGYRQTFPKGKAHGLDLRATALKEAYEESGLRIRLVAHLLDVTRSASRTRYFLAQRLGGNPADMGWESQAVLLAPMPALKPLLNQPVDHPILTVLAERLALRPMTFTRPDP